ncbi:MAG: hypothetical protein IJK23_10540 [Clostridia bacterium]|nr:hypothetical protein [Clostridia bacterium]
MDPKEKKKRKEKLSEHVNLGNSRLKDYEVEKLESLVDNREEYDGSSKTYRSSYKTFDSEDTYRVNETETFTFRGGDSGIRIDRDFQRDWDDGQRDEVHESFDTARDILTLASKIFRKK